MRLFGLVALGFWLTMMTILVKRDVLPAFGRRGDPGYQQVFKRLQDMVDSTMGIYIGERRIGTSHDVVRPVPDGGYQITNETELDGRLLGAESLVLFRSTTNVDASFHLASFDLSARLLGSEATVRGTVLEDELVIETQGVTGAESREEKRIALDGPITLATGLSPIAGMPDLEVGKEWTIVSIDPLEAARGVLSTETRRARVEAKESLWWGGRTVEAYVVKIDMHKAFARECAAWITPEGDILKQRMSFVEMRLEKVSK